MRKIIFWHAHLDICSVVIFAMLYFYLQNVSVMANDISKIVRNVFIKYEHYIGIQPSTLVYMIISVVWYLTGIQKEPGSILTQEISVLAEKLYVFPLDLIKGREFHDRLNDCPPLENYSALYSLLGSELFLRLQKHMQIN
jgi:hypothetical protein